MRAKIVVALQTLLTVLIISTLFITATYAWFVPALGFVNKIETNVIERALSVKIFRYAPSPEERRLGNSSMDVFELEERKDGYGYKLMYDSSEKTASHDKGITGIIPNVSGFYKIELYYTPLGADGYIPEENLLNANVTIDFIDITGNKVYNESRDIITRATYIQTIIYNARYNGDVPDSYAYYGVSRAGGGTYLEEIEDVASALSRTPKYPMASLMSLTADDDGKNKDCINIGNYNITQSHKLTVYYNYSVDTNETIGTEFDIKKYRFTVR